MALISASKWLEVGLDLLLVVGPLRRPAAASWASGSIERADRRDVDERQADVLGADAAEQALEPGVVGERRAGPGVEDRGDEVAAVADDATSAFDAQAISAL